MSGQGNAVGDYAQEIAQLDSDLQPAVALSQTYDQHLKAAEQTLEDAMSVIFDAFSPHYHNRALLKAYCAAKNIPWSEAKYTKNPFLPIIQSIFNLEGGKQTQVTGALSLACEQGVPKGGFDDWLDDPATGGVRGAYDKHNKARKAKKAQVAAGAQAPWLIGLHKAATLMRALTRSATANDKGDMHPRMFVLHNSLNDEGTPQGVLEVVSSAYTFVAARMTFEQPIAEIGNRSFLFSDGELGDFENLFPVAANWTAEVQDGVLTIISDDKHQIRAQQIDSSHSVLGLRRLARLGHCTDNATARLHDLRAFGGWLDSVADTADKWTEAQSKFGPRRYGIDLDRDVMIAEDLRKREWRNRRLPRALDFDGAHIGFMKTNLPFGVTVMTRDHHLFTIPPTHSFIVSAECQLHVKHATRLCKVFGDAAIEPHCYVVHAHEAESAFVCEAGVPGGRFLVAFPTVMNPKGVLRCLAEDIPLGQLVDTGVDVSEPAQSPAAASQTVPLQPGAAPPSVTSAAKPDYTHVTTARIGEEHVSMLVRQQFGAYITCYRPKDDLKWAKRFTNFKKQLTWWATKTDVSIYLNFSGWKYKEIEDFINDKSPEMKKILKRVVEYDNPKAQPLIDNRIKCLDKFYCSDHRWGIIMDDDAALMSDAHHNSSWRMFAEMAVNGPDHYKGVDVFFPINPQKSAWQKDVNGIETVKTVVDGVTTKKRVFTKPQNLERHRLNHVFTANTDLKGSMFVVRNFRLEGRPEVLPDPSYTLHGEDTYFAMLAISLGYSVRRCNNMVLDEYTLPNDSHFGLPSERRDAMREGNQRLVEMFGDRGLRMKRPGDRHYQSVNEKTGEVTVNDHLLFKDDFILECLGKKPQPLDRPKPQ